MQWDQRVILVDVDSQETVGLRGLVVLLEWQVPLGCRDHLEVLDWKEFKELLDSLVLLDSRDFQEAQVLVELPATSETPVPLDYQALLVRNTVAYLLYSV